MHNDLGYFQCIKCLLNFAQARLEDTLPCEMLSTINLVDLTGSKSVYNEVRFHYFNVSCLWFFNYISLGRIFYGSKWIMHSYVFEITSL